MEYIYKLCEDGNIEEIKKIDTHELEKFKKDEEYDYEEFSDEIQIWLKYGNDETLRLIGEIDSQRFLFGDWESDLESVMRGNCYDDSRICEYIRNLEALVEHLKTKNNI